MLGEVLGVLLVFGADGLLIWLCLDVALALAILAGSGASWRRPPEDPSA